MSLHTIANDTVARRLHPQPTRTAVAEATPDLAVRLSGMSMRMLETGLALVAIVTALLIGLGR